MMEEKLLLRRWRRGYLYASVCLVGVHFSPETETVVRWLLQAVLVLLH